MRYSVKNVIIYEKLNVRIRIYVKIRGTNVYGVKFIESLMFWGQWKNGVKKNNDHKCNDTSMLSTIELKRGEKKLGRGTGKN